MVFNMRYLLLFFVLIGFYLKSTGQVNDLQLAGNSTGIREISLKECRAIFKGKYSNWKTNEQVIIVLPTSKNDVSQFVAKVIFDGTVKSMQKFWLSLVFQGRSNPPIFLENDQETIQYILKNPGAIGFVSSQTKVPKSISIELK
jgi:ABC-type phosphate transport system substrate-binding protein